jgi:hypothetical protein
MSNIPLTPVAGLRTVPPVSRRSKVSLMALLSLKASRSQPKSNPTPWRLCDDVILSRRRRICFTHATAKADASLEFILSPVEGLSMTFRDIFASGHSFSRYDDCVAAFRLIA